MTALATWCGPLQQRGDTLIGALLTRQSLRGDTPTIVAAQPGSWLGASPFQWQTAWTGTAIGRYGQYSVASDATLYYIDDLIAELRAAGAQLASRTPSDLIAAALDAWGERAIERLEGDYAFVAIDASTRTLLAARDWGGLRSLYFAATRDSIAFASEASPLTHLPGVDARLNVPWLAEAAAGRYESPRESAYLGVELVPAGSMVRASLAASDIARSVERVSTFSPPTFLGDERPAVPFEEAKVELRQLMEAAVRERLPATGEVTVGLSGGRDSTAVYALARRDAGERLHAVSVSYPEGDPGREDDVIRDVLQLCGGETQWIDATTLPIFATIADGASTRHEPFGHAYAEFQEALARAARSQGARVLLNGSGGDQLFSGEPSYLADLVRHGKLRTLIKEWRRLEGGRDWRAFFRLALWPNVGPLGNSLLTAVRGAPYPDPFDRPLPPWIRRDFAERVGLPARHKANFPDRRKAGSAANFERRWLLTHPFFPRVFAEAFRLYLKEGVELRAPLADSRLLRFAATRPRWERRDGWQVKMLMRASLTDVLPHSVTGNRHRPTGTTEGLLQRALQQRMSGLIDEFARNSILTQMGILDVGALSEVGANLRDGRPESAGLEAVYTILAEVWARSHIGNAFPVAGS
ncbi:MAG: hypothetical protein IT359_16945 [Gemmatimonadaceae bacterium]|nr:hypothetical protein [Gemmatimonadaceae bacterium]